MTKDEHNAALREIESLMDKNPAKDSPDGIRLSDIAIRVQDYERDILNVAREREKTWQLIVKEPLFQFLKHDPTGRKILILFANGQISLGKCAEAITEKFCLGLDPLLPEYEGHAEGAEGAE
jgi:hypothetical protein